jgi:hypothetical protein
MGLLQLVFSMLMSSWLVREDSNEIFDGACGVDLQRKGSAITNMGFVLAWIFKLQEGCDSFKGPARHL